MGTFVFCIITSVKIWELSLIAFLKNVFVNRIETTDLLTHVQMVLCGALMEAVSFESRNVPHCPRVPIWTCPLGVQMADALEASTNVPRYLSVLPVVFCVQMEPVLLVIVNARIE